MSDDFNDRDLDLVYDKMEDMEGIEFPTIPAGEGYPLPEPNVDYPIEVVPVAGWHEKVDAKRRAMYEQEFAIAERWAAKPNLTNAERCHGVVWEMHRARDLRAQEDYDRRMRVFEEIQDVNPNLPAANAPVEPNYRAPEYATFYDNQKASDIKEFLAKSAKELFD